MNALSFFLLSACLVLLGILTAFVGAGSALVSLALCNRAQPETLLRFWIVAGILLCLGLLGIVTGALWGIFL